jgi:hypothetical protein
LVADSPKPSTIAANSSSNINGESFKFSFDFCFDGLDCDKYTLWLVNVGHN